jgi:exosortase
MSVEANNPSTTVTPAPSGVARSFRYSSGGDAVMAVPTGGEKIAWDKVWLALGVGGICLYFLYSTALLGLRQKWSSDSGWSHGFVVPFIAAFFVKLKWDVLAPLKPRGTWLGFVILLVGVIAQISFRVTGLAHMSSVSVLVVLFGTVLFIFGWEYLKVLWLPIAYLAFAVPPPEELYVRMTTPMQIVAAEFGVQLLPLFGCEAQRSGTVIDVAWGMNTQRLNVEQACSGMRMLVAFFALAVALAYSTNRPVWQKLLLAGCALPIAILCNGLRVAGTGLLAVRVGGQWAEGKAHEYFGLLMLGPAMLMQLSIAWVLDRIFVDVPEDKGGKP